MLTHDPVFGAATPGAPRARATSGPRATGLACACLFVAMLNLTLVVAGLKELVVDDLGGSVADAALFFTVEMVAYLLFAPIWRALSDRLGRRRPFIAGWSTTMALLFDGANDSAQRSRSRWAAPVTPPPSPSWGASGPARTTRSSSPWEPSRP